LPSSVYPTATTIYNPEKSWNGYTIFQARDTGATLIDMNGNIINQWKGLHGFPNKMLPGGYVVGSTGIRNEKYGYQDYMDLVQVDWEGNIVWKFDKHEYIRDPRQKPMWMARQHHDYQREGNPVGYYVPGMEPSVDKGNTMILCHKNLRNPEITDKELMDDVFIEVTWDGKKIWEWTCSEHFAELGFSEEARNVLYHHPNLRKLARDVADWMHINSLSLVGPNKWYDSGDERFHPDNIIWSSRMANILAITDKRNGQIVWRMGPDYNNNMHLRKLGQIIGPHHVHLIPRGLPGEGNILVFDNGGMAGYGNPNPGAPLGINNAMRDYSRVLEFEPLTLDVVWKYTPIEAELVMPMQSALFYSSLVSSVQRLPNGNTLITEGATGRIFEVTPHHETVWEYLSPFYEKKRQNLNYIYRAYRIPYEWVPQVDSPVEKAIPRTNNSRFRVPDSPPEKSPKVTVVKTGRKFVSDSQFCALSNSDVSGKA